MDKLGRIAKEPRSLHEREQNATFTSNQTAIPQPEGSEERYPSVLLDLGVGEKAEEIRMTL